MSSMILLLVVVVFALMNDARASLVFGGYGHVVLDLSGDRHRPNQARMHAKR